MSGDLVSVVIPCYNHGHLLADAIRSVLAQTHAHVEVIAVDDGSTDNTSDVAASFGPPVRPVRIPNSGSSVARNRGLNEAEGEWVQFLDADDVLLPTKIASCVEAAEAAGAPAAVYCDYLRSGVDATAALPGNRMSPEMDCDRAWEEVASRWEETLSIPLHAFLFHASLLRSPAVRFDPELPDHEDWDFVLRVLARRPVVRFVPEALAVYRRHAGAKCRVHASAQGVGFCRAIEKQLELVRGDKAKEKLLRHKLIETQDRFGLTPLPRRVRRRVAAATFGTVSLVRRAASLCGAGRARRFVASVLRIRR